MKPSAKQGTVRLAPAPPAPKSSGRAGKPASLGAVSRPRQRHSRTMRLETANVRLRHWAHQLQVDARVSSCEFGVSAAEPPVPRHFLGSKDSAASVAMPKSLVIASDRRPNAHCARHAAAALMATALGAKQSRFLKPDCFVTAFLAMTGCTVPAASEPTKTRMKIAPCATDVGHRFSAMLYCNFWRRRRAAPFFNSWIVKLITD